MVEKPSKEKKDIKDNRGWEEVEKADEIKGMKEIKDTKDTKDIKETNAMDERKESKKANALDEAKDSKEADGVNRIKGSNPAKSTKDKSHIKKNKGKEEKSKDKSEKIKTKNKKSNNKISLEKKIGFFILLGSFLTGVTLVVVLLFFTPDQPNQQPIINEYAGVTFEPPEEWTIVPTADEGMTIRISDLEGTGLVMIGSMVGNLNESLEANLILVSALLLTDAITFEQEDIQVAGNPGIKNRYVVVAGDYHFDIAGFLFPNGRELLYVQLATPMAEGGVNPALLERVEDMVMSLELPPSEFFRTE